MKIVVTARRILPAVVLAATFGACGGSGGDGGGGTASSPTPWVSIDPTATRVQDNSVNLYGQATCDNCPPTEWAFGYCPSIGPPMSSSVDVAWTNRTTGATGGASHAISGSYSYLFSYCTVSYSHKWSASIPLVIGENLIEIAAIDPSGASGNDNITITRTLGAPQGVTAEAGNEKVTLSWNPVAGATSYNVYWSTSGTLTTDNATKIAGVATPYAHGGLTNGVSYYYIVAAVADPFEGPASPAVWATAGWRTEVLAQVAGSAELTDTSIALDAAGNVHVHYSYDECLHYSSIGGGSPIQYCDSRGFRNYYLTNAGGDWASILVDQPSAVDADIAVASDNTVHFTYNDFPGITHAAFSSGTWSAELIDERGRCDSSLAVDSGNHPHVAYPTGYASGGVFTHAYMYSSNAAGSWALVPVDNLSANSCTGTAIISLALDNTGAAHLAYAGAAPAYGLKYASNKGGTWAAETVDAVYVASVSLALDAEGVAHIAYTNSAGQLKYARQDMAGGWTVREIDGQGSPASPSLAVDGSGNAHLSYGSALNGATLRYATNATGTWRISQVGTATRVFDTALVLDSEGKAHISYFDGSRRLRYATNR